MRHSWYDDGIITDRKVGIMLTAEEFARLVELDCNLKPQSDAEYAEALSLYNRMSTEQQQEYRWAVTSWDPER